MARLLRASAGGRVDVVGTVVCESGDPGGVVTSYIGGRVPKWAAQAVSTDSAVPTNAATASGRVTIAHTKGRSCLMRRSVTPEARTAAYEAAVAAGRRRISLLELTS